MSIDNFKPTIWTAKLLKNLNDAHVYANCLNRDYEGEISKAGDTVKINSIGRITIGDYDGTDIGAPEELQDSQLMLAITEAKFFNFKIDDVDAAQSNINLMNDATQEAAWGLADAADTFIAALLAADVSVDSVLTALTSVGTGATDDDAYEALVDLDVKLTENNVPRPNRWCVVPPWVEGLLRKDPRFVSFGTDKNRQQLRGEPVGEASGFTLWISNNVPLSSTTYTILAGYKGAATFAEQIPPKSFEAYRPEGLFADALKGLHVYGAKVSRPYALASVDMDAA